MRILSLELENWKCFDEKKHLDFSEIEVFSFPNGSGKTAVLEAMSFGLWGKVDYKKSTYQNHTDAQTIVSVDFEKDGRVFTVRRTFPHQKATIVENDIVIKEGTSEVNKYMDMLVPYNIMKRLWFKGEISNSELLSMRFFQDEILEEKLATPKKLLKYYRSEYKRLTKEISFLDVEDSRSSEVIRADIKTLEGSLKERSLANESQYIKALEVKDAVKDFENLKEKLAYIGIEPVSQAEIREWNSLDENALNKQLEEEMSKRASEELSSIAWCIQDVKRANDSHSKCVICGGDWTEEHSKELEDVVRNGLRNDKNITSIKEKLQFKNSISQSLVDSSIEYWRLKEKAESLYNYEEIIDKYDKANSEKWDRLDSLRTELSRALKNEENAKKLQELVTEEQDKRAKAKFIKEYIDKAAADFTSSFLKHTNDTLTSLNDKYRNLTVDEDSDFVVNAKGIDLHINQISRGEKTLVAFSIILAVRDMFSPGMPLVFDESFSGLSEENNTSVMEFIANSQDQVFIVSHDNAWVDFGIKSTKANVRTEW